MTVHGSLNSPTLTVGDNQIRESVVGDMRIFTSSPGREQIVLKHWHGGYIVDSMRDGPAIADVIKAVETYMQITIGADGGTGT